MNMEKMKIVTVVGTRPEIIRLSSVINKLEKYFKHILIHTGQNYDFELNEIFFDDLGLKKPQYFLDAAGKTSIQTIANILLKIEPILLKEKPDAVLVLGDTNSCLSLLAAKKLKIPTFHMEAGNRCFDFRVPEEINRRIVDQIADINLTYSSIAREYLMSEGFSADRVIKIGSPMKEVILSAQDKVRDSTILKKLHLKKKQFFLISAHREENVENTNSFIKFIDLLNWLIEKYSLPVLVSTHPRTRNKLNEMGKPLHKDIILHKPLCFTDYLCLQINAKAVLSDSGTITEESSILNFAALNIRESHERPEGMEEGSVMLTGFDIQKVMNGLQILEDQNTEHSSRTLKEVNDYSDNNVSEKVARIILSYTNYVKRVIWQTNN